MTPQEIQKITSAIEKHLDELFHQRFDREVPGHIESEAKNLLYTVAGDTLRDLIQKEIRRRVTVDIAVTVKDA